MVFNTLTGKQKSSWCSSKCGCIDVKAFGPAGNVSALQKTFSKRFKAKNTHPSRYFYFYIYLCLYVILMCIYFPQAAHWAVVAPGQPVAPGRLGYSGSHQGFMWTLLLPGYTASKSWAPMDGATSPQNGKVRKVQFSSWVWCCFLLQCFKYI